MKSKLWTAVKYLPAYLLCVLAVGFLWPRPYVLSGFLFLLAAFLLWRWHTRTDLCFFLLGALLGPLGELFAVARGAWEYPEPNGVVPIWLPLGWGISMLFLGRICLALAPPERPSRLG